MLQISPHSGNDLMFVVTLSTRNASAACSQHKTKVGFSNIGFAYSLFIPANGVGHSERHRKLWPQVYLVPNVCAVQCWRGVIGSQSKSETERTSGPFERHLVHAEPFGGS